MSPTSAGRSSANPNGSSPDPYRDADPEADGLVEVASTSIPIEERMTLWVRSGGRCAICNEYLLENEFTGHVLNLGEMAHNVGRKRSERSPRGIDDLPIEERNKAENLLLLCDRDHKTIDNAATRGDWPVERLRELKRAHEDRIRYVTGLRRDAETVVLRVIGEIQGAGAVELSHATVIKAVQPNGLYPRYVLGPKTGSDRELDLRAHAGEGTEIYWRSIEQAIADLGRQLADGVQRDQIRHLSVFAFARIPALVLLGHQLDDKIPTDLYQRQRDDQIGWGWDPDADPVAFETARLAQGDDPAKVTVVCSLSGTVQVNHLPREIVEDASIYAITPIGTDPNPSIMVARESLSNFAATYRAFLARLEIDHPDASVINVVPAVPLTAAIELGRARMKSKHPALRVYDRADGQYTLAVDVRS
jgi:SMODS-associated and fused to various effectors sensor domain